jgi:hypothetical protein
MLDAFGLQPGAYVLELKTDVGVERCKMAVSPR